jgi:hypothetical protein
MYHQNRPKASRSIVVPAAKMLSFRKLDPGDQIHYSGSDSAGGQKIKEETWRMDPSE